MTANHRALDAADIALIDKVKGTPSLYDSSSPDFKFAYRKEQLWENVAALLGMTAVDARRRWTCLRDRYSRELKQMRLHPEKGEFGNNDFFRQMDFLRKFVRKRRERRRVDAKFKCDSSWDGSNDDATKMHQNKSELTAQSEDDIFEDTQDQYDAKLEVSTTEAEEGYPEFVEDGQLNEGYEEYVEPVEHGATMAKYAMNSGAATPRHPPPGSGSNNNTTPGVLPIAFLSNAVGTVSSNYMLSTHKTSPQAPCSQKHSATEMSMGGGAETEDDFFCKTIGSYLRQLSRRHKIKAKVEMFQILEKYIELEENPDMYREERKG